LLGIVELAHLDVMKHRRPELGGVLDVRLGHREAERLPIAAFAPHKHDTDAAAVDLDARVPGQLGF